MTCLFLILKRKSTYQTLLTSRTCLLKQVAAKFLYFINLSKLKTMSKRQVRQQQKQNRQRGTRSLAQNMLPVKINWNKWNSRGAYNAPIRNRRRNPYKSRYNRRINQGSLPTIVAPRTIGNVFKTYTTNTNGNLEFCIRIPSAVLGLGSIAIPIHPMFYPGRLSTMCSNCSKFRVISSSLHYVPIVGTDEGGNIIITQQRNCIEVSQNLPIFLESLTQLGATITPTWSPCEFKSNVIDPTQEYPINPVVPTDIPSNYFAGVVSPEGNHAFNFYGNLYLQCTLKLVGESNQTNITPIGYSQIFSSVALGIQAPLATTGTMKIIVSQSTATNVDVGEFVIIPTIVANATPTKSNVIHNTESLNYDTASDRGDFSGLCLQAN